MRTLVDAGQVDLKTALRAQTAAEQMGGDLGTMAAAIAQEMKPMTNVQQRRLTEELERNPDRPLDEALEDAKTGTQVTSIMVVVGVELHRRLQQYASDEGSRLEDAGASLIEEALMQRGYN